MGGGVVVGTRAAGGGGGSGGAGGVVVAGGGGRDLVDGGELELDQHHVVAQAHRQVQRRRARQKVVHLRQIIKMIMKVVVDLTEGRKVAVITLQKLAV